MSGGGGGGGGGERSDLPQISKFELGSLRLQAFGLLVGWGKLDEDGKWREFNMNERRSKADDLVEWACRSLQGEEGRE